LSGLFWPDGERSAARAAAAAGTAFCLSHASVCTIEQLAATGINPRWMQIFIYRDRGFTREFIERAQAAGYHGLVLTTDNQLLGNRERDIRNGFSIPPRFGALDMIAMTGKLPWLMRMGPQLPKTTFANYVKAGDKSDIGSIAKRMGEILDPGLSRPVERPVLVEGHPSSGRGRRSGRAWC